MSSVFPTPHPVGCKRQQTGDEPNNTVRALGFEKRAVSAIVEDNERTNEEQATEQSERNAVQQ